MGAANQRSPWGQVSFIPIWRRIDVGKTDHRNFKEESHELAA